MLLKSRFLKGHRTYNCKSVIHTINSGHHWGMHWTNAGSCVSGQSITWLEFCSPLTMRPLLWDNYMQKFYTYSSFFSLKNVYIYIVIQWLIRPLLTHCFSLIREYYSSTSRAEFPSASTIMDGFGGADLTISRLRNKRWSWMSFECLFLSYESVLWGSLLNFFSLICLSTIIAEKQGVKIM